MSFPFSKNLSASVEFKIWGLEVLAFKTGCKNMPSCLFITKTDPGELKLKLSVLLNQMMECDLK